MEVRAEQAAAARTIFIRPFAERDAAQVRDLFIRVNRLLAPTDLVGAFEAYITSCLKEEIDRIADYYAERGGGFWVAIGDSRVVGMFGVEAASADAMELRRMYVDPEMRRQGIARMMLQVAEDECRRRKRARIDLSTSELQGEALSLYRSAGYRLVREEVAVAASNKTLGAGIRRFHFTKSLP
jgi:GNAT superfamily N-acetyltransferase